MKAIRMVRFNFLIFLMLFAPCSDEKEVVFFWQAFSYELLNDAVGVETAKNGPAKIFGAKGLDGSVDVGVPRPPRVKPSTTATTASLRKLDGG